MGKDSQILLLTFITNDPEDEVSSGIALDFSHKIKQYFAGCSDECCIPELLAKAPWNVREVRGHFEKLQMIFQKISKMKKRMQRELLKVKRLGGTPKQTSSANFAQLFEQF